MARQILGMAVIGVLLFGAHAAAEPRPSAGSGRPEQVRGERVEGRARADGQQSTATSGGKRILWTLVGAGIGYGAGLFYGLYKFDDAINSDRKVHTSAILGAVGGAVAGGLLSRNVSGAPTSWPAKAGRESLGAGRMPAAPQLGVHADRDRALRRRVRAATSWCVSARPDDRFPHRAGV